MGDRDGDPYLKKIAYYLYVPESDPHTHTHKTKGRWYITIKYHYKIVTNWSDSINLQIM